MFVPLWMTIVLAASGCLTVIAALIFHAVFSDL